MQFEARELKPYADTVLATDLVVGSVYYNVAFLDWNAQIPILEPLFFIGRNLKPGDDGKLYFQDYESFHAGVRFPDKQWAGPEPARYVRCPENDMINVHEFETALDELLWCSLRRRGLAPSP